MDLDYETAGQEPATTQGQEPITSRFAPSLSRSRSLLLARPGDPGDDPPADPPSDPPADPAADPPADPEPATFDAAYVKKLRDEAAANRKRAADAEAKLKKREDAELSELQKAEKERDEAKAAADAAGVKARDALVKATVTSEAVKLKFTDPDLALLAIRDQVTFSDDGEPENIAELLKQFATDRPHLVGEKPTAGAGGEGTNPAGGKGTALTADQLRGMTQEQIRDLYATDPEAVRKALSS